MQLFVNARFLTQPLSGVQRYGIEISRQIKKLNPEAVFFTPKNIIHKNIAKELDAKIIGISSGHIWEQSELPLHLSNNIPLFNPGNTAPYFYANNYITIHDLAFRFFPQWNSKSFSQYYNWLIPKIAKKARHVFTVSNTVKKELHKYLGIPDSNLTVTYNGIPENFKAHNISQKKEQIVLSVGSFNKRKNSDKLIQAFLQSGIRNDYVLIVVGNRDKIFAEAGISTSHPNIQILENVNDEQLLELYQRAEMAVSLSQYEGFGIPVLEALFFGCKTLASDIKVYHEIYNDYVCYCNPQNIADVTDSLEALAKFPTKDLTHELLKKYNYRDSATTILNTIASK